MLTADVREGRFVPEAVRADFAALRRRLRVDLEKPQAVAACSWFSYRGC